jgi:hypothetical protein
MTCPICGGEVEGDTDTYPNLMCVDCDDRAVNENGDLYRPVLDGDHDML